MKQKILILLSATILSGLFFSGCAVSNRAINYSNLNYELPKINLEELNIAVWDQRNMVLDGSRKPDFVGYLRPPAGIAWPMGTKSTNKFADDIASGIAATYSAKGVNASVLRTNQNQNKSAILKIFQNTREGKLLLIKANTLHTDGPQKNGQHIMSLHYDLDVQVYNENGDLITRKIFEGERFLGKGPEFEEYIPEKFTVFMSELLNDREIVEAINTKSKGNETLAKKADIIFKSDGTEIKAIVIEITADKVKYKKYNQPDGPIRNISKSNLLLIKYKDGTKEVFNK